jgi:RNA polymerase sigma-70 factor (ECF subfamily)
MSRANARLKLLVTERVQPPEQAQPIIPALDDSELVAAMRRGDDSASTALHDRLRPRVEATIGRLLGGRDDDHEDLVQASMIEIVQSIERYRGDCSLDFWAATIAAHAVYKHLRRRQIERRIFSSTKSETDDPVEPVGPGRTVIARDLERYIRKHLDAVDETKSWTFLLHDVCGFDLREVAQITGVTVAAAQRRLVRGRREIHDRIAADPELANALGDMETES